MFSNYRFYVQNCDQVNQVKIQKYTSHSIITNHSASHISKMEFLATVQKKSFVSNNRKRTFFGTIDQIADLGYYKFFSIGILRYLWENEKVQFVQNFSETKKKITK